MATDYKTALAAIEVLAEQYPQCFVVFEQRRRPLKLGIREDLITALAGAATAQELGFALKIYTSNSGYLRACKEGAERVGLDGKVSGHVTADEAKDAATRLAQRCAKQARRQATPIKTEIGTKPKRISLADLRAAAQARRAISSAAT